MPLIAGDKVRVDDGREGAVILVDSLRKAAMVLLRGHSEGAHAVSIDLDQLTKIDAYMEPG
jgi:hypothetical protein